VNARLARVLTRLYPRPWRKRYGEEFQAFLEAERVGVRAAADIVCAALGEHIIATRGGDMDQTRGSLRFHSWCVQAPWAVFALAPPVLLAGAYLIACLYLWSGWVIFLPEADTPFGVRWTGPPYALQNLYFQFGKFYYFGAPILVGWVIGVVAARQRIKTVWPGVGLVFIALMGGTAEIQASRSRVPAGLGHIRMDFFLGFFALRSSSQAFYQGIVHALMILLLTVLPWLIWRRFQKTHPSSV
jgi:hypothetical protein